MSDSSDSIDILQPTQPFTGVDNKEAQPHTSVLELKTPSHDSSGPKRVFVEDSDDNEPSPGKITETGLMVNSA